jgi:hypothetical protein
MERSGARGARPHLEAHLVIALAGAPVGHGGGAVAAGLGHQVAHDHRTRQGGDQRVLALVAGVGLPGPARRSPRPSRLGRRPPRPPPRRRPGRAADGVPILAAALGGLPDVDRDGDHLDALVLDQPTDGHRRIEATAVGQHHSLSHLQSIPFCSLRLPALSGLPALSDAGHVAQPRRHRLSPQLLVDDDEDGVVAGHGPDDRVQSAAIERRAYDMGRSGGVRSTTRLPEYATSTTHSPSTRRRWSSGAIWCTGSSGSA